MKQHTPCDDDREYFSQLMDDFPVAAPLSVDEAQRIVSLRFDKLNTENFIQKLTSLEADAYSKLLVSLPRVLHRYLFDSILSNAGEYRKLKDPNNGIVFFGPVQRFHGSNPKKIKENVQRAILCLSFPAKDAVYNAVKFYQQFVWTHPFYDANGRIGRFLLEMYLNMYGIVMQWKKLYANDKWLKKLNDCHKRFHPDSLEYERYLAFLASHWKKYTYNISKESQS